MGGYPPPLTEKIRKVVFERFSYGRTIWWPFFVLKTSRDAMKHVINKEGGLIWSFIDAMIAKSPLDTVRFRTLGGGVENLKAGWPKKWQKFGNVPRGLGWVGGSLIKEWFLKERFLVLTLLQHAERFLCTWPVFHCVMRTPPFAPRPPRITC